MKKAILLFCCLVAIPAVQAQSFLLEEEFTEQDVTDTYTGIAITNDTIELEYVDVGYVGNVGMGIAISVTNTSNQAKTIGAKKIHFAPLQADVDHIFCFADQCYGENVFISPLNKLLNANSSDSGTSGRFLAHYNFNTNQHVPGTEMVAYVIYDVNNPSDSAVVWVKYKTPVFTTGMEEMNGSARLDLYPNPAHDFITVQASGIERSFRLVNAAGETVLESSLPASGLVQKIDISSLPEGIYFCISAGLPARKLIIAN